MEIYKATLVTEDETRHLELEIKSSRLRISLTEDLPKEVKEVFNQLVLRLQVEQFNFALEGAGADLFSQVAIEYVTQLNKELTAVHSDLKQNGMLKSG